jgi:hypothetical protein
MKHQKKKIWILKAKQPNSIATINSYSIKLSKKNVYFNLKQMEMA